MALINPFEKFDKQWAIVTAGTPEHYNGMTISWGGMGTLWSKPVITTYVRPDRYTYEFMKDSEYFAVSFFDESYKRALGLMGSLSGKNTDKVKDSGLTPVFLENGITYKEAKETFICKKIYTQQLNMQDFPEDAFKFYNPGAEAHYMIIGEVISTVE